MTYKDNFEALEASPIAGVVNKNIDIATASSYFNLGVGHNYDAVDGENNNTADYVGCNIADMEQVAVTYDGDRYYYAEDFYIAGDHQAIPTGGSSLNTIFLDNFTDADETRLFNHIPDIGSYYGGLSNSDKIFNNCFRLQSVESGTRYISTECELGATVKQYAVSFKYVTKQSTTNSPVGIFIGATDEVHTQGLMNNIRFVPAYYASGFDTTFNGSFKLVRNGTLEVNNEIVHPITEGNSYRILVTVAVGSTTYEAQLSEEGVTWETVVNGVITVNDIFSYDGEGGTVSLVFGIQHVENDNDLVDDFKVMSGYNTQAQEYVGLYWANGQAL